MPDVPGLRRFSFERRRSIEPEPLCLRQVGAVGVAHQEWKIHSFQLWLSWNFSSQIRIVIQDIDVKKGKESLGGVMHRALGKWHQLS